MKRIAILVALTFLIVLVPAKLAVADNGFSVEPSAFDPYGTHLVVAEWEAGIGCATNANTTTDGVYFTLYSDPACLTGDPSGDTRVEGLLLAKTKGANYAAAGATIEGVSGIKLTELGYDIRKPGSGGTTVAPVVAVPLAQNDPRGSHCGAGAPRFNITTGGFLYFLGCNSPAPDTDTEGIGWQRLRWGTATDLSVTPQYGSNPCNASLTHPGYCNIKGQTVDSIEIVFDEGDDTGTPDNFGLAVLDNIDINTTLIGKGPEDNENKDDDNAQGEDKDHDAIQSKDSLSRPESSSMSYRDASQGMNLQSVNGARSITYSGPCVSYAGDAVMNGNTGYVFSFEACSVSLLGQGIGTFSMTVTGPAGFLYQKIAVPMTSGYVNIHPH
jgi:hypothetical protein